MLAFFVLAGVEYLKCCGIFGPYIVLFTILKPSYSHIQDTRELVVHQLLVKVAGWQSIDIPVSVDKIGVFFREVWPSSDTDLDLLSELPLHRGPVRLVFVISLNDVQKVVNVRSALVLSNRMEIPLEVKLEPNSEQRVDSGKSVRLPVLSAKGFLAVPIHLTSWYVFVRPQHWGVRYCSKHLPWRHVTGPAPTSHTRACHAIGGEEEEDEAEGDLPMFRFCMSVQRDKFPSPVTTTPTDAASSSSSSSTHFLHPAHTLMLLPPLTVSNILPCDLLFSITEYNSSSSSRSSELHQRRLVAKGKEVAVYSVDSLSPMELEVVLEGFEKCQGCVVSPDRIGVPQSLVLEDYHGRPLRLTITTSIMGGSALKVGRVVSGLGRGSEGRENEREIKLFSCVCAYVGVCVLFILADQQDWTAPGVQAGGHEF